MFITKLLQLIDKNPDNFKHWGCDFNCVKSPYKFRNTNPVCRYMCHKLYSKVFI